MLATQFSLDNAGVEYDLLTILLQAHTTLHQLGSSKQAATAGQQTCCFEKPLSEEWQLCKLAYKEGSYYGFNTGTR